MTMKKLFLLLIGGSALYAQTNPAITQWMQNTTNIMGRHYVSGNPTPIADNVLANVQSVKYSANSVYVTTHGIPAYITGPFLDGNPSLATDQNAIYKLPLNPVQNSGTPTATTGGNIGIFINGVSLFDYRDGVAWNNTTQALCGGPGNPPCPGGPTATQAWNRDAIPAEKGGFDCNKAHPAMGNYHHHQNPSAFNLDLQVISTICNTYPADGLYVINTNTHSPLIGFAYDGFPIYGAYAYTNTDGSGGISRMKSSYQLKNQTIRTNGPAVNATYYNGYFREDYEYVSHPNDPSYLDEHNGRFCITPEYPNGIYCYFATVDANHNSAYPYIVGPTFYGVKSGIKVTSITEATTTYTAPLSLNENTASNFNLIIAPNPAQDFIAIQTEITNENFEVILVDELGKTVKSGQLLQGSTLCILETDGLYNGVYFVKVRSSSLEKAFKVIIEK